MRNVITSPNRRARIVKQLVERDGKQCSLCGYRMGFVSTGHHQQAKWYRTIDHIVPPKLGGAISDLSNLRLAHRTCNGSRGQKEQQSIFMNSDWWFMNAIDPDTQKA